jgi:hypothetical protein
MRMYDVTCVLALKVNSLNKSLYVGISAVPGITYIEIIYLHLVRQTTMEMLQVHMYLRLSTAPYGRIRDVEIYVPALQKRQLKRDETSDNLSAHRYGSAKFRNE